MKSLWKYSTSKTKLFQSKIWKFAKLWKVISRFWAFAHRQISRFKVFHSTEECSAASYCLDVWFSHILCTLFIWPMVPWSIWNVLARHLQLLLYSFDLLPLVLGASWYLKTLMISKNSSIPVRTILKLLIWIEIRWNIWF